MSRHQLLCVAENSTVAKTASAFLSESRYRVEVGPSKYNPNFIFTNKFKNEDVQVCFTSVCGHIFSLDFTEQYRSLSACSPMELWNAKIVEFIRPDMQPTARNIQERALISFAVMLWLDNDKEGESISEEVEKLCKEINSSIYVCRARFSALSNEEVTQAFFNPSTINRLYAAESRMRIELDFRIGSVFTRFLNKWNGRLDSPKVISFGTVQFPILGFVVDAWKRREKFIPESYWIIDVILDKDNNPVNLKWDRKRLFCQLSCFTLYSRIFENPIAQVERIFENKVIKYKPLPLSIIELQKCCSNWLKLSSVVVMKLAYELYQSGAISYPITETDTFPDSFNFQDIIKVLQDSKDFGIYANKIIHKVNRPRNGKHIDNFHPPIYPIKIPASFKSNDSKKVFDFITRHFLACCSDDAIGTETQIIFDVGGEKFHLKGFSMHELNWLEIYPFVKFGHNYIPQFTQNEVLTPKSIKMNRKETIPPPLLSESDLIDRMNNENIVTDGTFSEHIKMIESSNYVVETSRMFLPTSLGLALINGFELMGVDFTKPKLRAEIEQSLRSISEGNMSFDEAHKKCIHIYKAAYLYSEQKTDLIDKTFSEQEELVSQGIIPSLSQTSKTRKTFQY